jgi:hypothetical protein
MLRKLGAHPMLKDRANHGSLPPCWRTLHELSTLEDKILKAALADGRIHPGLERREVRALSGKPPSGKATKPIPLDQITEDTVHAWLAKASVDSRLRISAKIFATEQNVGDDIVAAATDGRRLLRMTVRARC